MFRSFLTALALSVVFVPATRSDGGKPVSPLVVESEPDVRKSRQLDHCPTAADLARLQSVEGKTADVVLRVLGHPSRVERRRDGEQVWHYSWCAACSVRMRNGVCVSTFYTGGY